MAISSGKAKGAEPDVEELLEELEQKVERLKVLYEQYFMGIEKMEPHTARKEASRKLLDLQQMHIRNTGLRYRFNSLNQKFQVYVTYWNRTLRAIENGTYVRHIARASRDALRHGTELPEELLRAMPPKMRERVLREREKVAAAATRRAENAADAAGAGGPATRPAPGRAIEVPAADLEFDDAFDSMFADDVISEVGKAPAPKPAAASGPVAPAAASRPVTTRGPNPAAAAPRPAAPTPAPARPAAATALPPGMDEQSTQELYKRFVQAKKLIGENTDNIKYEHIVATIAKQAPGIMTQHKAKGVEFSVVIKDDKVILKATPKK